MKFKKILFLSFFLIIGFLLFMPNSVNATGVLDSDNGIILYTHEGVTLNYKIISGTEVAVYADDLTLTNVIIPEKITTNNGENVYTVTKVENRAFLNCTSLINVEIPNSVKEIGDSAFDGCMALISIIIPDSVNAIGEYVFKDCTELTISGYFESYAHSYANANNIPFYTIPDFSYTLTFKAEGGKFLDNSTEKTLVYKKSNPDIGIEVPIRDGYMFGGFVNKNGETFDNCINDFRINEDMEFYAEWIKIVDTKVIDFTQITHYDDLCEFDFIIFDYLVKNNLIIQTPEKITDDNNKLLVSYGNNGEIILASGLSISDNVSYVFTEIELNEIALYNNAMFVGKITEIPRKVEVIFANNPTVQSPTENSGIVNQQPELQPEQPSQVPGGEIQNQMVQTNNPKTGDTITIWVSILIISLGGLILTRKKQ